MLSKGLWTPKHKKEPKKFWVSTVVFQSPDVLHTLLMPLSQDIKFKVESPWLIQAPKALAPIVDTIEIFLV